MHGKARDGWDDLATPTTMNPAPVELRRIPIKLTRVHVHGWRAFGILVQPNGYAFFGVNFKMRWTRTTPHSPLLTEI